MTDSRENFDFLFLGILTEIIHNIVDLTEQAMAEVKLSAQCVLPQNGLALFQQFLDLYFGESASAQYQVNKDVDDLFDSIQSDIESGVELNCDLETNDTSKRRISISVLQKQLESTLLLDSEMQNKILPFISSLEFASELCEKMERLIALWLQSITSFSMPSNGSLDVVALVAESELLVQNCIAELEVPVEKIVGMVKKLAVDIDRVSKTSSKTKSVIHELTQGSFDAKALKVTLGALKSNPTDDLAAKLLPILEALHFQDKTKQQLTNLTPMMKVWQVWRLQPQLLQDDGNQGAWMLLFGEQLVRCATTQDEVDVICDAIPGTNTMLWVGAGEGRLR